MFNFWTTYTIFVALCHVKKYAQRFIQFSTLGSQGTLVFLETNLYALGPRAASLAEASNQTWMGKNRKKTEIFDQ